MRSVFELVHASVHHQRKGKAIEKASLVRLAGLQNFRKYMLLYMFTVCIYFHMHMCTGLL